MTNLITGSFTSIEQAANSIQHNNTEVRNTGNVSFRDVFSQKKSLVEAVDEAKKSSEVRFSKHADMRLKEREIELSNEQLSRLNEGTIKAGMKGIKESLVILDDLAFIVNVPSNTVVTAMDQTASDENIFTNIDGAVIV